MKHTTLASSLLCSLSLLPPLTSAFPPPKVTWRIASRALPDLKAEYFNIDDLCKFKEGQDLHSSSELQNGAVPWGESGVKLAPGKESVFWEKNFPDKAAHKSMRAIRLSRALVIGESLAAYTYNKAGTNPCGKLLDKQPSWTAGDLCTTVPGDDVATDKTGSLFGSDSTTGFSCILYHAPS